MIKKAYFELKPADRDNPEAIAKANKGVDVVYDSVKCCVAKKELVSCSL